MFCSNCGTQADGNFCYQCGHPLQRPHARRDANSAADHRETPTELQFDNEPVSSDSTAWERSCQFDVVASHPDVRNQVNAAGRKSGEGIPVEKLLKIYDATGLVPISMDTLMSVAQPLTAKLGIAIGKEREAAIPAPIGRVIARVLISHAKHGRPITHVEQAQSGCRILADLPLSLWTLKGELITVLTQEGTGTHVTYSVNIPGQYYDFGKSNRLLAEFLHELQSD